MKNVGIIGVGKIGKTIAAFLNKKPEIFKVHLADLVPWDKNESIMELDASNIDGQPGFPFTGSAAISGSLTVTHGTASATFLSSAISNI